MDKEEIISILNNNLTFQLDYTSETKLVDVVEDSMDIVEVLAVVKNEFGVNLDMETLNQLNTVDNFLTYISENSQESSAPKSF